MLPEAEKNLDLSSTKDMNIFAADFLEQKGMFDFEGAGIIIAIKSGTKDTRKKPYKVISQDVKDVVSFIELLKFV